MGGCYNIDDDNARTDVPDPRGGGDGDRMRMVVVTTFFPPGD